MPTCILCLEFAFPQVWVPCEKHEEHALCYACLVETVEHAIRQNPPDLPIYCPGRDGPSGKFRCSALMDDTIRQCMSNELLVEYDRAVLRRGTMRDGDHHCFFWTPCCNKPFEISRKDCRLVPRLVPCPFGCRKTMCTGCVNTLTPGQVQRANERQLHDATGDRNDHGESGDSEEGRRRRSVSITNTTDTPNLQETKEAEENDSVRDEPSWIHELTDQSPLAAFAMTAQPLVTNLQQFRHQHEWIGREFSIPSIENFGENFFIREVDEVGVEEHDHLSDLCFDEFLHRDATDENGDTTGEIKSTTSNAELFRVFQRALDQNTPRCPTCKRVGLKTGSECNEITCSCGVKWCFCCGKRLARTGEEYVRWMDASPNTTAFMLQSQYDSSSCNEYRTSQTLFASVTASTSSVSSYNHQSWIEIAPIEHRFDPNNPNKVGGLCPSTLEHLATVSKVPEFVAMRDQYIEEVRAASDERIVGFFSFGPHLSVKPLEERLMPVFLRYRGWLALRTLQSRMNADTFIRGLQQFPEWRYDELICNKLGIPHVTDPRPVTTTPVRTTVPSVLHTQPVVSQLSTVRSRLFNSFWVEWQESDVRTNWSPTPDFVSLYPSLMRVNSRNSETETTEHGNWWENFEEWQYHYNTRDGFSYRYHTRDESSWLLMDLMLKLARLGQHHQVHDKRPRIPRVSFRSRAPIACSRT